MQSLVNELIDSFQYSFYEVFIMSKIISAKSQEVLVDVIKDESKIKNKWVRVTDSLKADGITSFDLESTKTGENEKLRAQVKAIIVSTFSATKQNLLLKDTKTLSDSDKVQKKMAQQDIGTYLGLIEKKLRKAEHDARVAAGLEDDSTGAQESSKSELQKIQAKLDEVLVKLNKLENAEFDLVETVKLVKVVKGMIPAV
jgi:hypothetical protein